MSQACCMAHVLSSPLVSLLDSIYYARMVPLPHVWCFPCRTSCMLVRCCAMLWTSLARKSPWCCLTHIHSRNCHWYVITACHSCSTLAHLQPVPCKKSMTIEQVNGESHTCEVNVLLLTTRLVCCCKRKLAPLLCWLAVAALPDRRCVFVCCRLSL